MILFSLGAKVTVMEIASIVASCVSLILAGVAIWFSLYFYTQGKNTERNVQVALEGIKTQTDALQALNARTLDRLTKYVTTPRDEPSQTIQILYAAIRDLPEMALRLRPSATQAADEATRRELVSAYIALWNYTATSNIWAGFHLPRAEDFNAEDSYHALVKYIVDRSAADFHYMTGIIQNIRPEEIGACPQNIVALHDEVQTHLRPMVGDTSHHFAQRAKQQPPNA